MFDKYTEKARRVVFFARYEASETGSPHIEPEHVLLGVFREEKGLALRLLHSAQKIQEVRVQVRQHFPVREKTSTSVDLPVSGSCGRVMAFAEHEAKRLKHERVGAAHLLLGILHEERSFAAGILRAGGITAAQLRDEASRSEGPGQEAAQPERFAEVSGLRDLTDAAEKGELGPLVGRDRELERIIHILSRRTKNNAVLVGEAGVGKTAIVEGLARRIAEDSVPPTLAAKQVIALDASLLTASRRQTKAATALEDLFDELTTSADTVLFVRGLFNLTTAGPSWAVVEAMHVLEPLLAHGRIQCIATGSPAGLAQTIEKAGMLARHFEVVEVAPVSDEDAVRVVSRLKDQFEQFHQVTFGEGAVEEAVRLSGHFLPHRQLPDRALDLIDEAAAGVRLRRERGRREDAGQVGLVGREDVEQAVAERVGIPLEAVRHALEQKGTGEVERIAGELAAHLPAQARDWLPFLAAYLARCSPAEAESLARAITAAKPGAKSAGTTSAP